MRFGFTIASAILSCAACSFAGTLTDTFGQSQNNCSFSYSAPYSNCDVVGNPALYDIQKATMSISNGVATISIFTNSGGVNDLGGHVLLGAFTDSGVTLVSGDIFLYNPANSYNPDDSSTTSTLQYGIAMTSRGSFSAGDLYQIGGDIYTETAQQALMDGSDYYRRDETVLMGGNGSPSADGKLAIANYGDGVTSAQYVFTVTVPVTSGLLNLESNGQIGLLFSSADCGNDVIQGSIDLNTSVNTAGFNVPSPEPGPGLLILSGIALLTLGRLLRKRTS